MVDVATLVIALLMAAACPECEAANARSMNDIAATPLRNNGSESASSRALSTRWGAIATGNGAMGVAERLASREEAERKAMRDCLNSAPGAVCKLDLTYHNQCAAVAWGDAGSIWARGPFIRQTEVDSLERCASMTTNCEVVYSGCSDSE